MSPAGTTEIDLSRTLIFRSDEAFHISTANPYSAGLHSFAVFAARASRPAGEHRVSR
jgi:hypothetical protein